MIAWVMLVFFLFQPHDEAILNHLQDVKVIFSEKDPMVCIFYLFLFACGDLSSADNLYILDPPPDGQNVGPDLDPNHLTL